jgi:REP element-mobilizing transposase RayT
MKTWRGHNREWNIHRSEDRAKYLALLDRELAKQENVLLAMVLMANHVHEIFLIRNPQEFSRLMRNHHACYGRYFNDKNGRCGKVAQDRPHTSLIQNNSQAMLATFYLLANPLRANLCRDLRSYQDSSYNFYAFGKKAPGMAFLSYPEWYLGLADTPERRQRIFRNLFFEYLRKNGLIPQYYSRLHFLGDPLWVTMRRKACSEPRSCCKPGIPP